MVKGKDMVTKVTCEVCQNHQSRLRALRNFSSTFIDGNINGAIKKDTVVKHAKTDIHIKAMGIDAKPQATDLFFSRERHANVLPYKKSD